MTPSVVILAALVVLGWFIATPFVIAASAGWSLGASFLIVWGVTAVVVCFVAGLLALDSRWLRRKR